MFYLHFFQVRGTPGDDEDPGTVQWNWRNASSSPRFDAFYLLNKHTIALSQILFHKISNFVFKKMHLFIACFQ